MELTDSGKALFIETARALKGSARRVFMARTVRELGPGGQRWAERELGWDRETIRKGARELASGLAIVDAFALRGRKRAEAHLPKLLTDIAAIADGQSQADPSFRTTRLYTRLTAAEVRRQLIAQKGVRRRGAADGADDRGEAERAGVPSPDRGGEQTPKKIAATDAIFARVSAVNQAADAAPEVLRVSLDAKATVKIGPYSRRGRSRVPTAAADHDFRPEATVTPVGLLLPQLDELFLYGVTSRVTSDCLADCLTRWWETVGERFAHITTLVLNLDNGPENHSRRTQFMYRLVPFAQRFRLTVRLAYSPPYHSKYNPVERCWGILAQHWNGTLLDSLDAVLGFAATMTWKGRTPQVAVVTTAYERGVTLAKEAMAEVEAHLTRLPPLEKYFVDIRPAAPTRWEA